MSRYGYGYDGGWDPYVPVAERKRLAEKKAKRRLKKGQSLAPIRITARKIATTFWGTAWCDNLEHYSDFANRLPRGRTYARNGSIVDLQIERGKSRPWLPVRRLTMSRSPSRSSTRNVGINCERIVPSRFTV